MQRQAGSLLRRGLDSEGVRSEPGDPAGGSPFALTPCFSLCTNHSNSVLLQFCVPLIQGVTE